MKISESEWAALLGNLHSIRAKVEHLFRIVKCHVWFQKNAVTRADEEPQPVFYVFTIGELLRAAQLVVVA